LSGLVISAFVYCGLHYIFPVAAIRDFVENAPPAKVLMREYQERWDHGDEVETVLETPKL
jgi:NCS1 family nucleobase:cation symporter-1